MGPGGPGGAPLDDKTRKKMDKEAEAIKAVAKALEKREKESQGAREGKGKGKGKGGGHGGAAPELGSQLWTTRYAPQTLKEICGNKGQVEKLQQWLHDWSVSIVFFVCVVPRLTSRQVVELEIGL